MGKTKTEEGQKRPLPGQKPDLTEANLDGTSQSVQLPLEREAVSVKTVKASWYKQLIEEEALDAERGTLVGKPVAVLSVHGRWCPSEPHVHLVWKRSEGVLRLSLVYLDMQDDPRYQDVVKRSQKRLEAHCDLLALLLAPTASYDTRRTPRKQMRIDTYQLSLSLDAFKVLEQVQRVRASYARDLALWQRWAASASPAGQEGKAAPGPQEAVTQAREVIKELGELGVRIFHPELIKREWTLRGGYSTDRHRVLSRREIDDSSIQRATLPPAPYEVDDRVLLYWERAWSDNPFEDEDTSAHPISDATMHRLARTHGYALRLALAESALQETQKQAQRLARASAASLSLLQDEVIKEETGGEAGGLPAAASVWEIICKEKHTFEEYRQRWNESLQLVAGLEQLFVA